MRTMSLGGEMELGAGSLQVDIDYEYVPAERRVMYYPDGSGYPGSPAYCDLLDVTVTHCTFNNQTWQRDDHWLWILLDSYAFGLVDDGWDKYGQECLVDAELSQEDRRW